MCGIVGILHPQAERPVDAGLLRTMNDRHVHRGPDGGDLHLGGGIGLGHRRLAIIDLEGGRQPLYNEDGTVGVVYNGEIYNFAELFKALSARGHHFKTRCDTEAIVHAWEEWGPDCVQHFRGMFAFAIWDDNTKTLFLARDRLGIKPLHYAELADGTVIFGSELKSLMAHPDLARDIDPLAVEDYFALGYIADPRSIYKSVRKLPAGHVLRLRQGMPLEEPREYWDVGRSAPLTGGDDTVGAELIERMRQAVDLRMVSDVPLGAFLSGGVDSSAVVAMMAQLKDDGPVDTCSIGFAARSHDESRYAQMVADRYHTRHRLEQVDPDAVDLVDQLAGFYDEPFADSSAMPTYRVCKLAREKVTVALSGDGGDELFAGYRRHRWHAWEEAVRSRLPLGLRRPVFGTMGRLYPKADWAPKPLRAKSTLESLSRDTAEAYLHTVSVVPDAQRAAMFSSGLRQELGDYRAVEVLRRAIDKAPADDPLSAVQYCDLKTYLPGDILTKVDRASMANSLEVRVPLLDHHFVEWAWRVPPSMRLRGREGKAIFKKALEPHVPRDVLYRPKMGFAVPLSDWFRGPLRDRLRAAVDSPALADSGLFDRDVLRRMVDRHVSGLSDNSAPLWSLLMFESFLRRHAEDAHDRPAVAPAAE